MELLELAHGDKTRRDISKDNNNMMLLTKSVSESDHNFDNMQS